MTGTTTVEYNERDPQEHPDTRKSLYVTIRNRCWAKSQWYQIT